MKKPIGCFLILVAIFALLALVFMFLWNGSVPGLFGGPRMSYPIALLTVIVVFAMGGLSSAIGG